MAVAQETFEHLRTAGLAEARLPRVLDADVGVRVAVGDAPRPAPVPVTLVELELELRVAAGAELRDRGALAGVEAGARGFEGAQNGEGHGR